ncbi:pilin, partial [Pseudomonas aeruginosa]|nr:pilin [Pseudomonas aeruginosa]MCT1166579.1 pilin [Pseudomonas aeruginosa]
YRLLFMLPPVSKTPYQVSTRPGTYQTPEISGTLGNSSGKGIAGAVITVKRDDKGVWTCGITGSPTNWKTNYAPANCPKS